jgi:hypothetical protein
MPEDRAAALLCWLVAAAGADCDDPVVLGYGAAWKIILPDRGYPANQGPNAWDPVISLAKGTVPQDLPGLGAVPLDTFLVAEAKRPAMPGQGHWARAGYDEDDWLRVLGAAELIRASNVSE